MFSYAINTIEASADGTDQVLPVSNCEQTLRDDADEHIMVTAASGQIEARCSLWWRATPDLNGKHVGFIGHYSADSLEAATALLDHATKRLSSNGCEIAVGPIDGSTWRQHRFVVESSDEPYFMFELPHPAKYVEHLLFSGFQICAEYTSAKSTDLIFRSSTYHQLKGTLGTNGLSVRNLDPNKLEEEMGAILKFSNEAFSRNYLFTPISEQTFRSLYASKAGSLRAELTLLLEDHGELVALCFGVPNYIDGKETDAAILKTLARKPGPKYAGCGQLMLDLAHERVQELGFSSVIHAFIKTSNRSRLLSDKTASTIRKYALFAKELTADK